MKKIANLFFILVAGVATVALTGCGGSSTAPVVTWDNPTSDYYLAGDTVKLTINMTSDGKLSKILVTKEVGGTGTSTGVYDGSISGTGASYNLSDIIPNAAVGTKIVYTVKVTDSKDNATTKTYTCWVTSKMSEYVDNKLRVYNIQGPFEGAYDLVGNRALSVGDADLYKDLIDSSYLKSGFGVVFPKVWYATNSTMYVKSNGFDYANANTASVANAYAAGTGKSSIGPLSVGDIILAKLRGGQSGYAVIKITEVNETTSDNKDNIAFSFKIGQ